MSMQHLLVMAGLVCATTATSQAAKIHWFAHNITNDITDVSTAGTVHDARTGRLGAGNDVTVNGVTFKSVENSGNLFDSLFANDDISSRSWGNVVTNASYQTFLRYGQRSGRLGQSAPPRIEPTQLWTTVNFTGLTVGNSYQIQIWFGDNASTPPLNRALVLGDGVSTGSPVFGTDAQIFCHVTNGGTGQYGIGVFVADAETQSFNVRTMNNILTTPVWTNNDHFSNGWQIRDQGVDNSPPSPDPMTWAVVPTPVTETIMTMTAATATDQTGVEYQFKRYAADGTTLLFTSDWQNSPVFVDTGLSADTTYGYTVTARDQTPDQFTGSPSNPVAFATTPELDLDPPTPNPMTWAVQPTVVNYKTVTMTATTATDDNEVEYQFTRWFDDAEQFTSIWQASPVFTDTGLSPDTTYSYTVKARDKSAGQNETAPSAAVDVTTDSKGAAPITWTAHDITNDIGNVSTVGSLVDARTGRLGVGNNVTVNGVTFKSVENSGNLFDSLFQNDTLGARGYGNVVTDTSYQTFLTYGQRSGRLGFSDPPRILPTQVWTTVEFFDLTVGNTYLVQIWFSDNAVGTPLSQALVLGDGVSSGSPEFGTDAQIHNLVTTGGAGQYAIGIFVANATNQSFNVRTRQNLLTTPVWTNSDHFSNGWQIRDLGVAGPPDAGTSTVTASPAAVPADGATTSAITVTLKDADGNPVPGKTVSLTGNTGNATIQTANNMSNGAGIVTFTVKSATAGIEQFTATVDALAVTQKASVNFLETLTIVIDLGTSPAGTSIAGGAFIGSGPANLPIPALPPGSILRSISVNATLEATSSANFASDLTVLFDTSAPLTGDDFSLGLISSSATASFNPAQQLFWTGGNDGVGTSLVETKTSAQWTGDIDLASAAVFLGNGFTGSDGTWSGTITLICDVPAGDSGYAAWSGGEPFDGDKNGDGVENGLAFLLGAENPAADARGLLPVPSPDGSGGLVLTFQCRNAASRGTSTLSVQHSSDLATWLTALVPDTAGISGPIHGVTFQVVPGDPLNSVTATIGSDGAGDGKLFGRALGAE